MRFSMVLLLLSCSEYTLSNRNNINNNNYSDSRSHVDQSVIIPDNTTMDTFESPINESIDYDSEDSSFDIDTNADSTTETGIGINTFEESQGEDYEDIDTEYTEPDNYIEIDTDIYEPENSDNYTFKKADKHQPQREWL